MTLLSFVLILCVIGAVVYGIKLAFSGAWLQLVYLALGVLVAVWILGLLGISLPTIPRIG